MKSGSSLFEQIDKPTDKKMNLFSDGFSRYVVRVMLACLFLALGTATAFAIATKGEGISHGLGKMLYVFVFSWSLVMILYMNAELGTSNVLYMTVGVYRKKVDFSLAAKTLFTCILFNLIGGVLFGFPVLFTVPSQDLPKDSFFFMSVAGRLEKTTLQILVEAMSANIVVNTAVLASMWMKDDAGEATAVIFIIFIFAFPGSEHVIVNFPASSLAYFASNDAAGVFTAGSVVHSLFWAFIGSSIGGSLIMGLSHAWLDKDNKNLMYFD